MGLNPDVVVGYGASEVKLELRAWSSEDEVVVSGEAEVEVVVEGEDP